jgi:3-hydroxybutyryl-CoA dehydrogenase
MKIQKIAVLGAGQMGSGIAEAAATRGVPVVLVKATPGSVDKARGSIEKTLGRMIARGKMSQADGDAVLGRITFTDDLAAAADADLLIESIVEDVTTKKTWFAKADEIMKKEAVLASNTSTLCITEMQQSVSRKDRFLGLHFFNPARVMQLVEVIPTDSTVAEVVTGVTAFVEHIGKTPVLVKDSTGFIVNRLLTPYMCDAIRAWESGLADVHGIDTAMQLGANHPMGPLALADYIGLDIVCAMAENLQATFKLDYMAPPATLKKLVKAGQLGRKTMVGFFDYNHEPPVPNPDLDR